MGRATKGQPLVSDQRHTVASKLRLYERLIREYDFLLIHRQAGWRPDLLSLGVFDDEQDKDWDRFALAF